MYGIMPPDIKLLYVEALACGSSIKILESKGNTYLVEVSRSPTRTTYGGYSQFARQTVMLYPDMDAIYGSTKEEHYKAIDRSKVTTSVKLWNRHNK